MTVNAVGTLHSVCVAAHGVAQILSLGTESLLASGKLVEFVSGLGRPGLSAVCAPAIAASSAGQGARVLRIHCLADRRCAA
jgi:hypothetical protein